jgi:eukaryotic sulfide quinone oxidoreductase
MYLADDIFNKNGVKQNTTVIYNTALPFIFGVKKYAEQLMKVVQERNIQLNLRTNLVSVDHCKSEAVFEKLDQPGTFVTYKYDLLHAAPPMKPYDELKQSPIVDQNGYVDIDKFSLQHKKYSNIFAIGDCTNLPTSKTAAAVAAQSKILYQNLTQVMQGKEANVGKYDGYTSCPLTVGNGKLILAEFDYNGAPLETFPIDQGKKSRLFYYLKKDFMPDLYWYGLVKGIWNGPGFYRKLMSFGAK